jgi:hypothetical protein
LAPAPAPAASSSSGSTNRSSSTSTTTTAIRGMGCIQPRSRGWRDALRWGSGHRAPKAATPARSAASGSGGAAGGLLGGPMAANGPGRSINLYFSNRLGTKICDNWITRLPPFTLSPPPTLEFTTRVLHVLLCLISIMPANYKLDVDDIINPVSTANQHATVAPAPAPAPASAKSKGGGLRIC